MIVVFEGLDGAGKTTLCDALKTVLNEVIPERAICFIKESNPGDSVAEKLERLKFFDHRLHSDVLFVYDRATIIDDFIYEPVFHEECSIFLQSPLILSWIKGLLQKALVIQVVAPMTTIKRRLKQRGDQYVTVEDLRMIREQYVEYYQRLGVQPVYVESNNLKVAVQQCIELISNYTKGVKV